MIVVGDVDLSTVDILRHQLDALVGAPLAATVVDLGGVGFMDSSGLSALVRAHNRAAAAGGAFTVANLQPGVRRILEVTGLLPAILIEDA